jgi:autotransporter-associated beta strand protein
MSQRQVPNQFIQSKPVYEIIPSARRTSPHRPHCWILLVLAWLCAGINGRAQDGFCMVNGTTTGGAGGPTVTVTNGSQFNAQIAMAGPRIIQVQGPITIGRVFTAANKTIIGLGTNATLLGNLNISDVTNVIVRNLRITSPANDGITIWNAQHVWVDHCTFYDTGDGACDMSRGSQYVTVSWCKFLYTAQVQHRFTMIADGYVDGAVTNYGYYTLHHNWWAGRADQRMPASSYGRIHMFNNYFTSTNNSYCSNARTDAHLLSVSNYYAGVKSPLYADAGSTGRIRATGNIYAGTTGIAPAAGTDTLGADLDPPPYVFTADPADDVPGIVTAGAGAPGPDMVPIPPKIWDGGGSGNNWSTTNNWVFDDAPRLDDALVFAGTTRLAPVNNLAANTEFSGLTFSNSAGAFVLTGNAINLGGAILNASAAPQNIQLNIDFGFGQFHFATNRVIDVSEPAGFLFINGRISGDTNASFNSYSITKTGPGLLTLNGINTVRASWDLQGGMVRFNTLNTNAAGSLGAGTAIVFNGGGLQWGTNNNSDISLRSVTLQPNGAMLDVGTNHVTFANPIGGGGNGGLIKRGSGRLTLNGMGAYSGDTVIAEGALALGTTGWIANSSRIVLSNNATLDVSARVDGTHTLSSGRKLLGNGTVFGSVIAGSGATVSPGFSIGTLVITNALTFQPGSTNVMELHAASQTNDLITGLDHLQYGGMLVVTNVAGTLAAGAVFKLFEAAQYQGTFSSLSLPPLDENLLWTNRLSADGTIAVLAKNVPVPPSIGWSVNAEGLLLSWPADAQGWRLEMQSNALSAGLSTNWTFVAAVGQSSNVIVPIASTASSVFYRLVYP